MNNKKNEATRTNGKRLLTQKEVGDFLNYVFSPDADHDNQKRLHMKRFICDIQTVLNQANRALEFAQKDRWSIARAYLNNAARTIDSLKRVAREVPPTVNEEKQS
ncbi:hypothetical protein D0662_08870 [Salmonella enterica]|nr:hypothetical protein [Salmonella enterica]EDT0982769.1 hypothetical protein [Salmonella enterica subsp. enterica serovar Mikawasima]EFP3022253.1 hypothetical protein [Salmonella enterica]EFS4425217.1 hypothetical protein [Salmonella enterica]EGS9054454.1 hypothetical protein [Salmonella enterica]